MDAASPHCIYIKSEPAEEEPKSDDQPSGTRNDGSCSYIELHGSNGDKQTLCPVDGHIKSEASHDNKRHSKRKKKNKKKVKTAVNIVTVDSNPKRNQPVDCPVCHKRFASRKRYTVHITVHTGAKPFECHCGKSFRLKGALRVHMKIHELESGESDKRYVCSMCGKRFMLSCHLRQHSRIHSNDKPFVCDMCGRGFKSKQHLLDHINTHSRTRPHMCSQCGSCFKRASYLRGHLLKTCNPGAEPKYRKPRGPPKNVSCRVSVEKPYACDRCNRTYNHVKNLKRHILSDHVGVKPHKCPECAKSFASKTEMNIHERTHSQDRPYPCPTCGFAFHQKPHLKRHLDKCRGARPFQCPLCHEAFADLYTFDAHRASHPEVQREQVKVEYAKTDAAVGKEKEVAKIKIEDTKIEMEGGSIESYVRDGTDNELEAKGVAINNELEVSKADSEDQMHGGYGSPPFVEVAGKFSDDDHDSETAKSPYGEAIDSVAAYDSVEIELKPCDPATAPAIKLESPDVDETKIKFLVKHVDKSKPFSCDQCGKTFRLISYLNKHILTHTNMRRIKRHECERCGKCFPTPGELRSHSRTHTGERPYACKVCGKAFGHRASVKSHMRTHELDSAGERARPYKCSECDKAFTEKITLELHRVRHTGQRPYQCKDCGKRFAWPGNLRSHSVVHTGVKAFVCGECGKGFLRKSTLRLHALTHGSERPFVCEQCGKSFLCASSLKTHGKTHVEVRPYGCDQCGKRFALPSGLKDHKKTHSKVRKGKASDAFGFACSSKYC